MTKRHVSGGTHSDIGRDCRDAFLGLAKTCRKLGIAFWDYLGARLGICGGPSVPQLPDLIRNRGQSACCGPGLCPDYDRLREMLALLATHSLTGSLWIVEPGRVRIHLKRGEI